MDTALLWIALVGTWIVVLLMYRELSKQNDLLEKALDPSKHLTEVNRRLRDIESDIRDLESDIEDLQDLRRMIGHFAKVIQDIARWSVRLERD